MQEVQNCRTMSREENQRVVFIQDGSTELIAGAIRWILHGLSLKPGDELTLIAILHQANSSRTAFSVADRNKQSGFKGKVVSHSMLGVNQGILDRQTKMKKEQYENNIEILQIYKLYEMHKVQFTIEVASGNSLKDVALRAAKNLRATWVILDRQMKRYKSYFLDKLSCGISRMKHNDAIELLRGPTFMSISNNASRLTYDEMLPGLPDEDDLFSIELSPACYRKKQTVVRSSFASAENFSGVREKNAETIAQRTEGIKLATFCYQGFCETKIDQLREDQNLPQGSTIQNLMESLKAKNHFSQSFCSICKSPKTGWLRDFTYAELQAATDGFSAQNCLSEGGSGSVFKGLMGNKLKVAVKKLHTAKCRREKKFETEIHALPIAIQKNVIMMLGCCWEGNHRLLVYEYACNGSLHQHLKGSPTLTWTDRMKVAFGASRGLNYLHQNDIIHGDFRSGCLLLNHDYEPMIGNFGLAQAYEAEKLEENKSIGAGRLSVKADVHSFGVVLLELITGQAINNDESAKKSLVRWAKPLLKERKYKELIDPALVDSHDTRQLFWMIRVAEKCLCKHHEKRLSMDKVLLALEFLVEKKETGFVHEDFLPQKPYPVSCASGSSKSTLQDGEEAIKYKRVIQDTEQSETTSNPKSDISVRSTSINFSKLFSGGIRNRNLVKAKSYGRPLVSYDEMLN